jgi:hypothetical protein
MHKPTEIISIQSKSPFLQIEKVYSKFLQLVVK